MRLNVYVNNNFVKREEVGTPDGGCFYIEGWGQIVEIFIRGGGVLNGIVECAEQYVLARRGRQPGFGGVRDGWGQIGMILK